MRYHPPVTSDEKWLVLSRPVNCVWEGGLFRNNHGTDSFGQIKHLKSDIFPKMGPTNFSGSLTSRALKWHKPGLSNSIR